MADPVVPAAPAAPIAPAAAPVAAPVAAAAPTAPAPAPVSPTNGAAAPAPAAAPVSPAAPVAAAPAVAPAEPAPAAPAAPAKEPTSLLTKAEEPAPAAEGDKKPDADAAPATEGPAEPAPAPKYEPFTFPEGLKAGEQELGAYTTALGEYELAIAKDPAQVHGETQKLGQRLVDMHIAELGKMQKAMQDNQREVFNKLQEDLVEQVRKDPEIGGNRFDTSINRALNVIKEYAGSDQNLAQLRADLKYTGATNLPSLIRLLNNIGKALSEPKVPVVAPRPVQTAAQQNPKQRRYAGSIPQKG